MWQVGARQNNRIPIPSAHGCFCAQQSARDEDLAPAPTPTGRGACYPRTREPKPLGNPFSHCKLISWYFMSCSGCTSPRSESSSTGRSCALNVVNPRPQSRVVSLGSTQSRVQGPPPSPPRPQSRVVSLGSGQSRVQGTPLTPRPQSRVSDSISRGCELTLGALWDMVC